MGPTWHRETHQALSSRVSEWPLQLFLFVCVGVPSLVCWPSADGKRDWAGEVWACVQKLIIIAGMHHCRTLQDYLSKMLENIANHIESRREVWRGGDSMQRHSEIRAKRRQVDRPISSAGWESRNAKSESHGMANQATVTGTMSSQHVGKVQFQETSAYQLCRQEFCVQKKVLCASVDAAKIQLRTLWSRQTQWKITQSSYLRGCWARKGVWETHRQSLSQHCLSSSGIDNTERHHTWNCFSFAFAAPRVSGGEKIQI